MKKMVENSTINEIIKGISALIGGAFGVKILDFFIQRRKKKEEKNKEVLISSLMSINTVTFLIQCTLIIQKFFGKILKIKV